MTRRKSRTRADAWGIHYERSHSRTGHDSLTRLDRHYEEHMEAASSGLLEALERYHAERIAA